MDDYELKSPPAPDEPERGTVVPKSPVVPYRPVAADRDGCGSRGSTSTAGPFALGFFAAVGVCAGSFVLLGSTYDVTQALRVLTFTGVVAALAGLFVLRGVLQSRFGFSGFGRGMFVGLMLGGIALGPCAGCYFLRLFEA